MNTMVKVALTGMIGLGMGVGVAYYVNISQPKPSVEIKHNRENFTLQLYNTGGIMRINNVNYVKSDTNFKAVVYDHFDVDESYINKINATSKDIPQNASMSIVSFTPKTYSSWDQQYNLIDQIEENTVYVSYSYLKLPYIGYMLHASKMIDL